jgi:hypothetical protein
VAVGAGGTAVGGATVVAGGGVSVAAGWTVKEISAVAVRAKVGVGVTGHLVGRAVQVGNTIQATGLGATLEKVGCGVRVERRLGYRCLANRLNAVLKMI